MRGRGITREIIRCGYRGNESFSGGWGEAAAMLQGEAHTCAEEAVLGTGQEVESSCSKQLETNEK